MEINFDTWQGTQIYEEQMSILSEKRAMQLIEMLKPEFSMDGNVYCYTYPSLMSLPNDCIQGFGETAIAAANDFNKNFYTQKAHGNKKGT
jgi:hypothetical protein